MKGHDTDIYDIEEFDDVAESYFADEDEDVVLQDQLEDDDTDWEDSYEHRPISEL